MKETLDQEELDHRFEQGTADRLAQVNGDFRYYVYYPNGERAWYLLRQGEHVGVRIPPVRRSE